MMFRASFFVAGEDMIEIAEVLLKLQLQSIKYVVSVLITLNDMTCAIDKICNALTTKLTPWAGA